MCNSYQTDDRTLAREHASHEARILRGFCSPFGPVVMILFSVMLCLGGDGED